MEKFIFSAVVQWIGYCEVIVFRNKTYSMIISQKHAAFDLLFFQGFETWFPNEKLKSSFIALHEGQYHRLFLQEDVAIVDVKQWGNKLNESFMRVPATRKMDQQGKYYKKM